MNLLECKNLSKYYSGKCALDRIDLTIESGKIVGLLGPNGSGKSTLIKMISGLLKPSDGELKVAGKDVGVETKKSFPIYPITII